MTKAPRLKRRGCCRGHHPPEPGWVPYTPDDVTDVAGCSAIMPIRHLPYNHPIG
jgi:hypothetical protein